MSEENVEVITDINAAMNEGDFGRAMGYLADDIVLEAPAGIRGGTFRGREAVGEWFGDWLRTFDSSVHTDIREITEIGNDGVLMVAATRGRGRGSGADVEETFFWLNRLREGKVTRVEGYLSRAQALEAAGLSE
jgi:ketosteroid isomerase-like protein